MENRSIYLLDGVSGDLVEALLRVRLPVEVVVATEATWKPYRQAARRIEHAHWDWALKTGRLSTPGSRIMGVECAGVIEGMVLVLEQGYEARLPPDEGRPLVYVDFLEAAPWNVRQISPTPRYRNVGPVLLQAAIDLSTSVGFDGRIGLHSLPQSGGFYQHRGGMYSSGPDPLYYDLVYFEFTAHRAQEFLEEDRR